MKSFGCCQAVVWLFSGGSVMSSSCQIVILSLFAQFGTKRFFSLVSLIQLELPNDYINLYFLKTCNGHDIVLLSRYIFFELQLLAWILNLATLTGKQYFFGEIELPGMDFSFYHLIGKQKFRSKICASTLLVHTWMLLVHWADEINEI